MKILVTGATGFLGSHLKEELDQLSLDVTYMIRGDKSRINGKSIIAGLGDALPLHELQNITHVINCAAQAKWGDDDKTWDTNVFKTAMFMDQINTLPNLQRVIHIGTAFTSGVAKDQLMDEDMPRNVHPFNVYTKSKNLAQNVMKEVLGNKLTVIAPSIIVGHTQKGCLASTQIWWLFELVTQLGAFTFDLDQKIDVIPVDYVVKRIIGELMYPSGKKYIHATAGRQANTFKEIYEEFDRIRGTQVTGNYKKLNMNELSKLVTDKYNRRMARTLIGAISQYSVFADSGITFKTNIESPKFTSYIELCDKTANTSLSKMIREDYTGE